MWNSKWKQALNQQKEIDIVEMKNLLDNLCWKESLLKIIIIYVVVVVFSSIPDMVY